MDIFVFLYNVALLLLYGITMLYSFINYRIQKLNYCLYLSILFLFYIFDNTVIYMTEFIHDFSVRYDASFMSVPAFKTVIIIVTAYCLTNTFNKILQKSISLADYLVLLTLGLWDLFIPLLSDSAMKVWLYYLPYQFFTLYLSCTKLRWLKKNNKITEEPSFPHHFEKLLYATLLFSFLIVIEDTIVIFNFDCYKHLMVRINNRSVTEDILSILYSIFFIIHFSKQLMSVPMPAHTESILDTTYIETLDTDFFYSFTRYYSLTIREQEILKELLENKNNQEISEDLFISLGTVKSHVHNIYQKINVTKRSHLIQIYIKWDKGTQTES